MRYLIPLIFLPPLLLGVVGVLFTHNKLEEMKQIRGWKPGAIVRVEVVHQKHRDPASGACWIALTDESILEPGDHRMNLEPKVWNRLKIGDPIEIVYLPGSSSRYTRDGIFADDGNFAFDRGLLVVESGMIVLSVLGVVISLGFLILLPVFRRRTSGGPWPTTGFL